MRSWAAALLVVVPGCAQLFGLDDPDLVEPRTVTGHIFVDYPHNDSNHVTVIDHYVPAVDAVLVRDDSTRVPLAIAPDGAMSFETATADARYAVRFGAGFGVFEIQHSASEFVVRDARTVRPDAIVAGAGTTLTYELTDAPVGDTARVFTSGQWMSAGPSTTSGQKFAFDWSAADANGVAPTLLSSSANDVAYLTLASPPTMSGVQFLERYRADVVDMVNGGNQLINGATIAVVRDMCVRLELPTASEVQRQAAAGFVEAGAGAVFELRNIAAAQLTLFGGPLLVASSLDSGSDLAQDLTYGNPLPGVTTAQLSVGRLRSIPDKNGKPISVAVGSQYIVRAESSCMQKTRVVNDIVLPGTASLDAVALDNEGKQVSIDRTRMPMLTWQRSSGRSHRTLVGLFEVTDRLVGVISWVTTSGDVRVDPTMLRPGATYVFLVMEQLGFPRAAMGDMAFELPYAIGFNYSSTFVVAN